MDTTINAVFIEYNGIALTTDKRDFEPTAIFDYQNLKSVLLDKFNYTLGLCKNDCYERISEGIFDIYVQKTPFIIDRGDDVVQFQAISQDGYFIMSPYNCSKRKAVDDSIPTDITKSFAAFTLNVWLLILLTVVLLCISLATHAHNHASRKRMFSDSFLTVVASMLLNPSFVIRNWTSKLISFLISMFTFLVIICYFMNYITTERVSIKDQHVFRSFREIADDIKMGGNVQIIYHQHTTFVESLSEWPQNEAKRIIAEHVKNEKRKVQQQEPVVLIASEERYDYVMIDGFLTTKLIRYGACELMARRQDGPPDTCLHLRPEVVDEMQYVNGMLISKSFKQKIIFEKFRKHAAKTFESGLIQHEFLHLMGDMAPIPSLLDCISDDRKLITHSPEFAAIGIEMYYKFFMYISIILIVALISLNGEYHEMKKCDKEPKIRVITI